MVSPFFGFYLVIFPPFSLFTTSVFALSDLFLNSDDDNAVTNAPFLFSSSSSSSLANQLVSNDDELFFAVDQEQEQQPVSNDDVFLADDQEQPSGSNDDLLFLADTRSDCSDHSIMQPSKIKSRNPGCTTNNLDESIKVPELDINLLNSIDEGKQPSMIKNEGDFINAWEKLQSYCFIYTSQPTLFIIPVCGSGITGDYVYQARGFSTKIKNSRLSGFISL